MVAITFRQHHDMEEDVSTAVCSYDHFRVELHQSGSGPCEHDVPLHILQAEHILDCRVEQKGIHVILGRVGIHIQFLRDGRLLKVRSTMRLCRNILVIVNMTIYIIEIIVCEE